MNNICLTLSASGIMLLVQNSLHRSDDSRCVGPTKPGGDSSDLTFPPFLVDLGVNLRIKYGYLLNNFTDALPVFRTESE